jgi:penicillin-binding protein 2
MTPRLPQVEDSPPPAIREGLLLGLVGCALAVVLGRLWYLQVAKGDEIERLADQYRTVSIRQMPMRGRVVDRNGEMIATVMPEDVVALVPNLAKERPDTVSFVSEVLGLPEERILRILDNATNPELPVPVAVGVTAEQVVALAEERFRHPALHISENPIRFYPDPISFSHAVGYVGPAAEADLQHFQDPNIHPSDYVGKVGAERQNERLLHGRSGSEAIEVNARGARVDTGTVYDLPPTAGATVTLTLDTRLQLRATELLEGRQGAVVALEPSTGEVLVMASSPGYDASMFLRPLLPEDWQALQEDARRPLFNRALQAAYPPGSPFKLVTAIAGLRTGTTTIGSTAFCHGSIRIGNRTFRCHRHHGLVDFEKAISESCDVFFYGAGQRAGREALVETALACGFGQRSGIDLPNERAGTVPTSEWLEKRDLHWRGGDTVNMSIGQGYLEATPIQLADLAALIANRGVIYRPHLLKEAAEPMTGKVLRRTEPEVRFRVILPEGGWSAIRRAMVECIESGTGRGYARIPGLVWAGKTGSAEHGRGAKTHAWFIGYAPAEDPKIAICVLVEQAGHGGDVAAPIAAELVCGYLLPGHEATAAAMVPPALGN